MNPQVFGKEHLTYVIVSVIVAACVIVLSKLFAKTEKSQNFVIKVSGAILFIIIFINRIALVFEYDDTNWLKLLTDSYCSTSSYVLSISLLIGNKNNGVLHFIRLIALAGGTITTFYPNFIDQNPSFLYPPTILGMMHHTWGAIVVVLMLMFGYIDLSYKKWYCSAIGFIVLVSYSYFLMYVLDYGNPFSMKDPLLDGTPFTFWVICPIYLVVYSFIIFVVEFIRRKRKKVEL